MVIIPNHGKHSRQAVCVPSLVKRRTDQLFQPSWRALHQQTATVRFLFTKPSVLALSLLSLCMLTLLDTLWKKTSQCILMRDGWAHLSSTSKPLSTLCTTAWCKGLLVWVWHTETIFHTLISILPSSYLWTGLQEFIAYYLRQGLWEVSSFFSFPSIMNSTGSDMDHQLLIIWMHEIINPKFIPTSRAEKHQKKRINQLNEVNVNTCSINNTI